MSILTAELLTLFLVPLKENRWGQPKNWHHGTKRLIPQLFVIFSGEMTMWESRKLVFTRKLQTRRICPSPVVREGFELFNLQLGY